ncbi:THO complex subunit 2 [Phytophthora boehmeriae]|uniref:THO complex subunit 2 n=1 Tax=Phytophthora boehmeriae TaxID=109152 RepID=A0A8T1WWH0_9STRA|nr:THO complex subunit 2 [Phytophthora boehmeriae]
MAALDQNHVGPGLLEFSGDLRDLASDASDEYGTFEVSMVEADSEFDALAGQKPSLSLSERLFSMYSEECLFVWLLLSSPFQLMTYRTLLFHALNCLFSVFAALCVVILYVIKLPLCASTRLAARFQRVEMWWIRRLLRTDCALFNFVSPRSERVRIYGASIHMQQEEGLYGVYAQLYFGGIKMLSSGIPGAIAALMFVWSLQNVVGLTMGLVAGSEPLVSSINGHSLSADHELDMMAVVAVVAIYACVLLLHVFAFISRQFTIFFCSQYLLYDGGM